MPELPEVQTTVNDLKKKITGSKIVGFWTDWPKGIRGVSAMALEKKIKGLKILSINRLGKNILITLEKQHALLIHQRMTGHLMVGRWSIPGKRAGRPAKSIVDGPLRERVNQHIHTILTLHDGRMVALSDLRKFARIDFGLLDKVLSRPTIHQLGPDALNHRFSHQSFAKAILSRKKSIKQTLMDQGVIAGIGNIYADDILWCAKIHPARSSQSLSSAELTKTLGCIKRILAKAVRLRGTSVSDYRDASGEPGRYGREVLVYQRTGQPCRRCGAPIKRLILGQRSAHFCPNCQKL